MSEVRAWHISEALTSYRRLKDIVNELTEDEVKHALSLETSAHRRKSIVTRLNQRLFQLHKEKYNAPS